MSLLRPAASKYQASRKMIFLHTDCAFASIHVITKGFSRKHAQFIVVASIETLAQHDAR